MDLAGMSLSGPQTGRPAGSSRRGWWRLAAAGAAAFWSANLIISWTPIAAEYRSALSIDYVPMLLEAAVGGLLIASAVAVVLMRYPERIPGSGPLRRALGLCAAALLVLTVFVEVPSKLASGVADPGRWLLVATVFNVIRLLALGVTIGLVARARHAGAEPRARGTERKGSS